MRSNQQAVYHGDLLTLTGLLKLPTNLFRHITSLLSTTGAIGAGKYNYSQACSIEK